MTTTVQIISTPQVNALVSDESDVAVSVSQGSSAIVESQTVGVQGGTGEEGPKGDPGSGIYTISTPPVSPDERDLWADPSSGRLSMFRDGTWIEMG